MYNVLYTVTTGNSRSSWRVSDSVVFNGVSKGLTSVIGQNKLRRPDSPDLCGPERGTVSRNSHRGRKDSGSGPDGQNCRESKERKTRLEVNPYGLNRYFKLLRTNLNLKSNLILISKFIQGLERTLDVIFFFLFFN